MTRLDRLTAAAKAVLDNADLRGLTRPEEGEDFHREWNTLKAVLQESATQKKSVSFVAITPDELSQLQAALDITPDTLTATLDHGYAHKPIEVYDEDSDGTWFVLGMEYGPTHVIRARNETDAYDIWLDLLPAIPAEDLHEAYNAYDKLREHLTSLGHEDTQHLRDFCNRYAPLYFAIDANHSGAWDRWELDEAYHYQPNATGTGIVHTGHDAWLNTLDDYGREILFTGTAT